MARTVSSFTVAADGKGDYLLNFEDEDGETIELTASFEQLDLIADAMTTRTSRSRSKRSVSARSAARPSYVSILWVAGWGSGPVPNLIQRSWISD
jgi:hypothetical protein